MANNNKKHFNQNKALVDLLKMPLQDLEQSLKLQKTANLLSDEFSLYHIQELTFDDESPRKEAFENVLSSLNIEGIIFVYLLIGDKTGVSFYFGIARDKLYTKELILDVDDIGHSILKPSIEGNFRGSGVVKINKKDREDIQSLLANFKHVAKVEGVPSVNEENEAFQGVDRLVDVMSGDDFCMAIVADPLSLTDINHIESNLHSIYDKLNPLSKQSVQTGSSDSNTKGQSDGSSTSKTTGTNDNRNISTAKGTSSGVTESNSTSDSSSGTNKGESTTDTDAKTKGTSVSDATSKNIGSNSSIQTSSSNSATREFSDKNLQEWLEYIDEVLLKRVQYGKNKGLYLANIYLFSNTRGVALKLGNTVKSLFSGVNETKAPLNYVYVTDGLEKKAIYNFQFPRSSNKLDFANINGNNQLALLLSKSLASGVLGSWLSTNELSVVAGLPQKEVTGLTLKEEVEFGLNVNNKIASENEIYLGNLVKSGQQLNIPVGIDKNELNKHTFIAGVTGSGKTTTCHRILKSANLPFMVIEPAKTEYRVLIKEKKDLLVFTLGNDTVAPFRLNPFEFFPHENITSRVDMIKASIEAAFDMEAAIPQLIEAAIYRCYENKGWNIATSKNSKYEDPFADGVYAFPTLTDLIETAEKVVGEQGFDDRLKMDYIGSIKARLQGLLIGAKGLMLNTARSIDFKDLAKRSVVLELEEIRNPSEKSLIMGFVLMNLNEAIRANYIDYKKRGDSFKHITLIEEAHRLLSKYEVGDSQNKKQGVEAFADMLAEVRKYGEALIIVDQIPNKLTPEVLKNTNTKIIHKLFAQDDKDAVGNTMALNDEQKDFLSSLDPGRIIMSTTGINKPLQVQVEELISTTNEADIEPAEIRRIALEFYRQNYRKGLIQGLEKSKKMPSIAMVESFIQNDLIRFWADTVANRQASKGLKDYLNDFGLEFAGEYILNVSYQFINDEDDKLATAEALDNYLVKLMNGEDSFKLAECDALDKKRMKK